jgi:hypothetical protein
MQAYLTCYVVMLQTIVGDFPAIYKEVVKAEGKAPMQLLRESKVIRCPQR